MSKNDDIIAMKLAQDSYMLAGDGNNALGCIARSMHLFDSSNQLQGHVMGMFAAGLLEVGRYSDAEEMANKAVTKTKGLDIWALHTLCNAYAMLGRSSEIGSAINEHINKHKNSTIGLPLLLFNKGCGLIMRGNSNAAVLAHDNIIFDIIDKKDSQVAGTLANATLLLWVISLNSPSVDIDDRWIHVNSVAGLWSGGIKEAEVEGNKVELKGNDESDDGREGAMRGSMSAMNVVCRAMALSASDRCATAALLKNSNMINNIEEVLSEEDKGIEMERLNKKKGRMSELQLAIYINKKLEVIEIYAEKIWFTIKRYTKPDWHMPAVKIEEVVYNKEETAARVAAATRIMTASAEAKARHHSDSLDILIKLSKDDFGDRLGKKEYLESICPLLLSVKPQVSAAKRIPESPSACSVTDKEWSIRSVAEPLFQAVLSFSQHDYDDSSDKLNECRLSQTLSRLGGTAAQRDIISQTLIGKSKMRR